MANDDILKRAQQMLRSSKEAEQNAKNQLENDRQNLVLSIGQQIVDVLRPLFTRLADQADSNRDSFENAIRNVKVDVNVPTVTIPTINVPTPQVTVKAPIVNIPDIVMPEEMDIRGWVGMMGYDKGLLADPIPVQIRDADGNPVDLSSALGGVMSSGGGGARIVKVSNLDEISITTTGLSDTELRASSVPVAQASGATWSVSVNDIFRTTVASSLINGDDRIKVSVETGGSGLTDAELRASSVPVEQVSGANWSTSVTNTVVVDGSAVTQPVSATALPLPAGAATSANQQTDALTDAQLRTASVPVEQVSGSNWSTSITNTPTVRPIQVRGSLGTAYASVSTGTEATLLAASVGTFHDLVWVMGANQSDVAVLVDFRMATAGNVVMSLEIPANSTAGIAPALPYPQSDSGNNWTVDLPDITGTTVDITALFSKEI